MTQKQNHTIYTQTHTYERCEGIWQPLHILVPGSLTSPLDLGCFSVSQEMKKNSRQASFPSFSTKCRLPPLALIEIYSISFSREVLDQEMYKLVNQRQNAGYHLDLTRYFWEKILEWCMEKEQSQKPAIEKQSTGTFDYEISSQVYKLGKHFFFLDRVNHL